MDLQKLASYIKQQIAQGIHKEVITNNLIKAGWQESIINQALSNVESPLIIPGQTPASASIQIITEQNYPIQFKWVFKSLIGMIIYSVVSLILFIFGYYNLYLIILILYTPIYFIILILRRSNFYFSIEDKFLTLKQGILSKQQRHIPYGVIQNVFVKQDIFDRIFNLASLTLENASYGAGATNAANTKIFGLTVTNQKKEQVEMLGFSGNKVSIPGLTKEDAESLKTIVLQKMKENPIEDSQSGL